MAANSSSSLSFECDVCDEDISGVRVRYRDTDNDYCYCCEACWDKVEDKIFGTEEKRQPGDFDSIDYRESFPFVVSVVASPGTRAFEFTGCAQLEQGNFYEISASSDQLEAQKNSGVASRRVDKVTACLIAKWFASSLGSDDGSVEKPEDLAENALVFCTAQRNADDALHELCLAAHADRFDRVVPTDGDIWKALVGAVNADSLAAFVEQFTRGELLQFAQSRCFDMAGGQVLDGPDDRSKQFVQALAAEAADGVAVTLADTDSITRADDMPPLDPRAFAFTVAHGDDASKTRTACVEANRNPGWSIQ
jgi:hypothetical protein